MLARLTTDTAIVQTVMTSTVSMAARNVILLVGGLVMVVLSSPKMSLVVLVVVPLVVVPLIFLGQKGVVDAMKLSLDACLKNIIPFIVYTLVISLILVVAAIPLLLGWLFVMPILAGAYYVSFKQLFVE